MTKSICVWYWFIFLPHAYPFLKISYCTISTSHDKGGACGNEKRKRCNRISSDITLGLNYPYCGIYIKLMSDNCKREKTLINENL